MYIPGGELEDGPCHVQGNWRENNGVMVKFEAQVNIKG